MEYELRHSARKFWIAIAFLGLTTAYLGIVTVHYLAEYFSESSEESDLIRATRLDPGDAVSFHNIGRIELLARAKPQMALPWLETATRLNPHMASYWVDLALARQAVGETALERQDLLHALEAAPRTPEIVWQAANLFLAQGSPDDAMSAFRLVIENDPPIASLAIETCWKVHPEVEFLLNNVIPPNADETFLGFLTSRNQPAAATVWEKMYSLQQPISRPHLFEYIRDLVAHQQAAQAALVWRQAASMAGLSAYQPSPQNLLVNGDFSLGGEAEAGLQDVPEMMELGRLQKGWRAAAQVDLVDRAFFQDRGQAVRFISRPVKSSARAMSSSPSTRAGIARNSTSLGRGSMWPSAITSLRSPTA